MPESPDQASPDRRASWVALRTLRQRAAVVGQTEDGDPVYEVRSVRLVLRPDASHFNRLVSCTRCGREVQGSGVHTAAQLDQPSQPMICTRCVRSSASTSWPAVPERPAPAEVAQGDGEVFEVLVPAEGRLALPDGGDGAGGGDLDGFRQELDAQRGVMAAQRRELETVAAAVGAVRTDLRKIAEAQLELLRSQRALDRRLAEVAELASVAPPAPAPAPAPEPDAGAEERAASVGRRIEALERGAADDAARISALAMAADAGASSLHALEQKVQASVKRLTRLVGSQLNPPPPPRRAAAGLAPQEDLLAGLELQLREAEGRLARQSAPAANAE